MVTRTEGLNMGNGLLERRQMLKGAGVIGAAALAALVPTSVSAAQNDEFERLLGTWDLTVRAEGQPQHEVVLSFAPGGVFVGASTDEPSPLVGSWVRKDDHGFGLTFIVFLYPPEAPKGSKIKLRAEGTAEADSMRGRFAFDVIVGGATVASGRGIFDGGRLPVEAV